MSLILSLLLIICKSIRGEDLDSDFNDTCSLLPINNGIYYGVESVSHSTAVNCCSMKNLSLIELPNKENFRARKWQMLYELLLTFPFHALPIGRDSWLHVSDEREKLLESYKNLKSCSGIYFKSPRNVTLLLDKVGCGIESRYLCETIKEPYYNPACKNVQFMPLEERSFRLVKTPMSWRDALFCCESKDLTLLHTGGAGHLADIISSLQHHSFIRKRSNLTFTFWTQGFRQLTTKTFRWFDDRETNYLDFSKDQTEFCLGGVAQTNKIYLEPKPCEMKLPFICQLHDKVKLENMELEKLLLVDTTRTYWYSGGYMVSWKDAAKFCLKRGFRLFTIISPLEGHTIANGLQQNPDHRNKHMGRDFGIWTAGRALRKEQGFYIFPYNLAKVDYSQLKFSNASTGSGDEHDYFINSTGNLQANCLQFVVDIRNSFILNNIPCTVRRSFICEESVQTAPANRAALEELGNQYFYSNPVNYEMAHDLCAFNKMKMVQLKDPEEMNALAKTIKNLFHNHTSESRPVWISPVGPSHIKLEKQRVKKPPPHKNPGYAVVLKILEEKRKLREEMEQEQTLYAHKPILKKHSCDTTYVNLTSGSLARSTAECSKYYPVICDAVPESLPQHYSSPGEKRCAIQFQTVGADYKLSKTKLNWKDARECCHTLDYELASIKNDAELHTQHHFLESGHFPGPLVGYWTSGTNLIFDYQFVWADSYEFLEVDAFYNNYTTKGAIVEGKNLCLEGYTHPEEDKLVLSHDYCSNLKRFLCVKRSYEFPIVNCVECEYVQMLRSDYFVFLTKVPWLRAMECCREHGADLVTLFSKEVSELLFQFVVDHFGWVYDQPENGLWIGLTSGFFQSNQFLWVGDLVTLKRTKYTAWNDTALEYINEDPYYGCVVAYAPRIRKEFSWQRISCAEPRHFICKKW